MERFPQSIQNDVDFYKLTSTAKNTHLSTGNWVNVYNTWAKCRNYTQDISNYEPAELNSILEKFYAEIRKTNGEHYEPSCLRIMMASIDRYLKSTSDGTLYRGIRNFHHQEKFSKVSRWFCDKVGKVNVPTVPGVSQTQTSRHYGTADN